MQAADDRNSRHWQFRPDIQGLRGVAILLVALYHGGVAPVPGGYIGVDVFFVISGYLITGLLTNERESTGRIDLVAFYARRARRLLPAVFAITVVALAFTWWLHAPFEQREIATSAFAAAVYLSNFFFALWSADYLAGDAETNPFLHTWSLAVEEQFYLLWPALLLVAARGAVAARVKTRLLVAVAIVSVLSFALCVDLTWRSQPWAFFGTWARAWEFGLGAATFLVVRRPAQLQRAAASWVGAVGAALIVAAALMLDRNSLFPSYLAAAPVLGTCMVILASHGAHDAVVSRFLASRPMRWLGDLSYSWYLWHWPVLVFGAMLYPQGPAWFKLALLLASLAFAQASYIWVEKPIRFSARLLPRHALSLVAMGTLSVCGAGLALLGRQLAHDEMASTEQRRYSQARDDIPIVYPRKCHANVGSTDHPGCEFGPAAAKVRVVLFGDSHAAQWFPALHALTETNGWRLLSVTKSACPSVAVRIEVRQQKRPYVECEQWRRKTLDRIAQWRPTLVVLANASGYVVARKSSAPPSVSASAWRDGARDVVHEIASAGIAVAMMRDTPWPTFDVPACLARAAWRNAGRDGNCTFDTAAAQAGAQPVAAAELAAVADQPGAFAIDMNDLICRDANCAVETPERVVFRDGNHLTASFSAALSQPLLERLSTHVPSLAQPAQ